MRRTVLVLALAASAAGMLAAQFERIDYQTLGRIRDEGLGRSQVMDHISYPRDSLCFGDGYSLRDKPSLELNV
jgi:hypothetical protein